MSFFARASWPGDHRDEFVAGALTAAVIVVLGYASGIGAPAPQTLDSAAPPAAQAPTAPSARSSSGPAESAVPPGGTGAGASDSSGVLPVVDVPTGNGGANTGLPRGSGGSGGNGGEAGPGGGSSPSPSPSSPGSPAPSPSPTEQCEDGQVHLVQPLLSGVVGSVTGLLDGLLAGNSPSPSPSPSASSPGDSAAVCVGVAPSPSLLAGVNP